MKNSFFLINGCANIVQKFANAILFIGVSAFRKYIISWEFKGSKWQHYWIEWGGGCQNPYQVLLLSWALERCSFNFCSGKMYNRKIDNKQSEGIPPMKPLTAVNLSGELVLPHSINNWKKLKQNSRHRHFINFSMCKKSPFGPQ